MEKLLDFGNWVYQINPMVILGIVTVIVIAKVLIFMRFFAKTFVVGKGFYESYQARENDAYGTVISAGLKGFTIAKLNYVRRVVYDVNKQVADDTRNFVTYSPKYYRLNPRYCLASSLKVKRFLRVKDFFSTKLGQCLWAIGLKCQFAWGKNSVNFVTQERRFELEEYNNFGLSEHLVLIAKISWWKYFTLKSHEVPLLVEYADGVKSYKIRREIRPVSVYLNKYMAVSVEFLNPDRARYTSYCPEGYEQMDMHYAKALAKRRYDFDYTLRALGLYSLREQFIYLGNDYFYHFPFGFLKKETENDWLLGTVSGVQVYVKCSNKLLA